MLTGLRTIVYHVTNLEVAKMWYAEMFDIKPYFDESFYVGFDINGFELGLDPSGNEYTEGNSSITYWKVDDVDAAFERLKKKKVVIHQEVHSVGEGIKLGSIKDPFGNVIGLIELKG
jgi:predicted enzyme related to lactoylglutathione lyase